jgi:hypothetical protein
VKKTETTELKPPRFGEADLRTSPHLGTNSTAAVVEHCERLSAQPSKRRPNLKPRGLK